MKQKFIPAARKNYGVRLNGALMRAVQHLAVDEEKNVNDLLEEAMRDLLKKYKQPVPPTT